MLMREKRNAYRILVGKPEGERQLGRYGRRWEDNVEMVLREWYGLDYMAKDREQWRDLVNTAMNLQVP
jgi:hypothetical protein